MSCLSYASYVRYGTWVPKLEREGKSGENESYKKVHFATLLEVCFCRIAHL